MAKEKKHFWNTTGFMFVVVLVLGITGTVWFALLISGAGMNPFASPG